MRGIFSLNISTHLQVTGGCLNISCQFYSSHFHKCRSQTPTAAEIYEMTGALYRHIKDIRWDVASCASIPAPNQCKLSSPLCVWIHAWKNSPHVSFSCCEHYLCQFWSLLISGQFVLQRDMQLQGIPRPYIGWKHVASPELFPNYFVLVQLVEECKGDSGIMQN